MLEIDLMVICKPQEDKSNKGNRMFVKQLVYAYCN